MKKSNVLEAFEKMAQELPDPPGVAPSKPRAIPVGAPVNKPRALEDIPGTPKAPSNVGQGPASAVKMMQEALINLSHTLAQNYLMKTDLKNQQPRGGSDPFGNFLVSQYLNNEDVVGKQFVNVDSHEPARSQTAMPNKSLPGVVNTIGRLGTPGSEKAADGIWMTRTDNSLRETVSLAASLVQLQKDMNLKVEGYGDEDLKELKSLVPSSYTQLGNSAAAHAEKIAANIQKLTQFYQKFESVILNNDKYKQLITQQKPFATLEKPEALSPDEDAFLKQNLGTKIPHANINGKAVSLGDIASPDAFKAFLQANNIPVTSPAIYNKYVSLIKNLVETGGTGY